MVDEDARELVADRLVDEQRRDRVSTPPERPQSTRSPPTCARIRSTCSSITAAGVHAGGAPATVEEVLQHLLPCGVCTTSGWNCTP